MSPSISDIKVQDAKNHERAMSEFAGNTLLIVNVASKCGFTPQYAGLEKLNQAYAERGLKVLGFPCNDFGAQEPGTLEEIQQFCSLKYDVSFEIFDKVHAKGDKSPLYARLTQTEPAGDVGWNFEKFLVGKDGKVIARYKSNVDPQSPELIAAIESAIDAKH
jgi:glutathione peroxidase